MTKVISNGMVLAHWIRARWRAWWLHGPRLRRYQERRARSVIHTALRGSPFFRTHWAGHDLRRWDTLPVVDKRTMMQHFDDYNTRGVHADEAMAVALAAEHSRDFQPVLEGLTVGLSSGISGHRGLFLVSGAEQTAWAGTILARTLHGLPLRRLRVAFFLRSNSNLYEQTNGAFIHFRYFDLMTPLDDVCKALQVFQPTIVVGPPSLLHMLAQAKLSGVLDVAPARLISVAEVLEPQEHQMIEHVFAAPVHQIYQCTEGLIAVSCRAKTLHIQEDIVRLQWEPLPDADDGTPRFMPIVTDLWRTTQPIIRYRLDYILQLEGEPCPCGSDWQAIKAIEGRRDDVCWFEHEQGGRRPFFPDALRRMVLLASAAILDYEIIQEPDGALVIHLSVPHTADAAVVIDTVRRSVTSTIRQYKCIVPTITVDTALVLPRRGTKRRRVQHRPGLL